MLREARIEAGLTQREVAARLHKSPSYSHKVETADRELNVIELMHYCAALNVDFADFTSRLVEAISALKPSVAQGKSRKKDSEVR